MWRSFPTFAPFWLYFFNIVFYYVYSTLAPFCYNIETGIYRDITHSIAPRTRYEVESAIISAYKRYVEIEKIMYAEEENC